MVKKFIGKTRDQLKDAPVIGKLLEPRPLVSVLRLSGVIADGGRRNSISYNKYERLIEAAFDVYDVKAVALVINSPGGSPAQSALIGGHIRRLAKEKSVPVYAFVEDVAASGGYWLACAADEIYAQEVSIVGSIGVISASFGLQDFIAKHNIERRIYTSGKDKSFLDPFVAEKEGDVKRLKSLQKDLHQSFIAWVKERREGKLNGADKDLFEGQFWSAKPALDLGIIDALGDVRSVCREKFGDKVKFIEFGPERGLIAGLIGGEARLPYAAATSSLSDDLVDTLENKAIWGRYGL